MKYLAVLLIGFLTTVQAKTFELYLKAQNRMDTPILVDQTHVDPNSPEVLVSQKIIHKPEKIFYRVTDVLGDEVCRFNFMVLVHPENRPVYLLRWQKGKNRCQLDLIGLNLDLADNHHYAKYILQVRPEAGSSDR